METRGLFSPADVSAARERWAALGPAAQTVTREVARAMEFDREEYDERVTAAVVGSARDALFASLLEVHVGDREEFEAATAELDYEIRERGSPAVDRVAWHVAHPAETVAAATFQDEPDAAVAALRRQAHGELYRELLYDDEGGEGTGGDGKTTPDGKTTLDDARGTDE